MIIQISTRYRLLWHHDCWSTSDQHPQFQLCSLTTSGCSSIIIVSTFFFFFPTCFFIFLFYFFPFYKGRTKNCTKRLQSNRKVSRQCFLCSDHASGNNPQIGLKDDPESSVPVKEGMVLRCLELHIEYLECWAQSHKGKEHYPCFFAQHITVFLPISVLFCRKETEAWTDLVYCLRHHSKALSKSVWTAGLWGPDAPSSTFEHGRTSFLHQVKEKFSRNSLMLRAAGTSFICAVLGNWEGWKLQRK